VQKLKPNNWVLVSAIQTGETTMHDMIQFLIQNNIKVTKEETCPQPLKNLKTEIRETKREVIPYGTSRITATGYLVNPVQYFAISE
jgi:hypothetical protein